MWNARLGEAQAEIKITVRNINNFRYADDTTLLAESEEELKTLLMKVKEQSEKAGVKLNIQETKIMASSPITSWQIDGLTMETMADFIFLGSRITADGDCSHEIKTLAPWKKSNDQPRQRIKKRRHYFTDKGPSSQSYVFSSSHVWMWELDHKESWAPKNWCFWTVVLEKTLESPLVSKEIKPVNPKANHPKYSLEELMLKWNFNTLATWCKEPTHWKRLLCWERLKAGGGEDDRGGDGWMASPTQWTRLWANSRKWWRTGKPVVLQSMMSQRVGHNWATEQQQQQQQR